MPPTGQKWTTLRAEQSEGHTNHIKPLTININSNSARTSPADISGGNTEDQTGEALSQWTEAPSSAATDQVEDAYTIHTTPKLGIGERAVLIVTPHGNVLWDKIAYLDDETVSNIKSYGDLKAIVISHPHFYTTHLDWAEAFDCPVYIAAEDEDWVSRKDVNGRRRLIKGTTEEIVPGVTAIKVGGHFPGSLVLHWQKKLFLADSIVTQPVSRIGSILDCPLSSTMLPGYSSMPQSALYHIGRPPGTISYTFMWSIPNMIPLAPSELLKIWNVLKPFEFEQTHGAFMGQDVFDPKVKERLLASMQIQAMYATGNKDRTILKEDWP